MDNKLSELRRLTPRQIAVYRDRVAISDSDYELIPVHTGDLRALLARIEELEAVKADASQVFKEIGNELGCNPDNESIMMAIDALKERLATPEIGK
ncbi:hypothetical protein IBZ16_13830 [Serratia marcescens]|uniref:hypothetical protein n=1 Tax=Serratia marcescens TaxID=615 RepID=UPI0039B58128